MPVREFGGLSKIHDQVSQACTCGELADTYGYELAPVIKGSRFPAAMMIICRHLKFMPGKKCNDLPEDCVMVATDSNLLVMVRFFAKTL